MGIRLGPAPVKPPPKPSPSDEFIEHVKRTRKPPKPVPPRIQTALETLEEDLVRAVFNRHEKNSTR